MKIDDFQTIFRSAFNEPEAWQKWFFEKVATDPDEIYIAGDSSGKTAAALLMQPYGFKYQDFVLPSVYISCVGTLPECRRRGLSTALLGEALADARAKGVALATLIPAEGHLYFFYGRRDFATVFYVDEEHYTDVHQFRGGKGSVVEPTFDILHGLEQRLGCGVLHTAADYAEILADMAVDGGDNVVAACDGEACAMLFAVADGNGGVLVKNLLCDNDDLALTALAELRRREPDKEITVRRPQRAGDPETRRLKPYGMLRIVEAPALMTALAASHPRLHVSVSLTDRLLPDNTATYEISGGHCAVKPYRPDPAGIDVSPEVLASILFGSHDIGRLFDIPARRPYMSLMLD